MISGTMGHFNSTSTEPLPRLRVLLLACLRRFAFKIDIELELELKPNTLILARIKIYFCVLHDFLIGSSYQFATISMSCFKADSNMGGENQQPIKGGHLMKRRTFLQNLLALTLLTGGLQIFRHRKQLVDYFKLDQKYWPSKDPALYPTELALIEKTRMQLRQNILGGQIKLRQASSIFTQLMCDHVFPYWLGTRWAFSGSSEKPQQGFIACGYFVTTTLQDAGLPIDRIKWAKSPSEAMIRHLVPAKQLHYHHRQNIRSLAKSLRSKGQGLYVIGLDTHTGFIAVDKNEVWFIHASGAFPYRVVKENILSASAVIDSRYRVVAKLSDNESFLRRWLAI